MSSHLYYIGYYPGEDEPTLLPEPLPASFDAVYAIPSERLATIAYHAIAIEIIDGMIADVCDSDGSIRRDYFDNEMRRHIPDITPEELEWAYNRGYEIYRTDNNN